MGKMIKEIKTEKIEKRTEIEAMKKEIMIMMRKVRKGKKKRRVIGDTRKKE